MRRSLQIVVALPLLFGTVNLGGFCSPVRAQDGRSQAGADVVGAERYADEAFQAYSKKDYAKAVALYRKAYDAAASADILYNIARIYDTGLRDRPLAITFYRKYVGDPGATPERIVTANERIALLRAAEEAAAAPTPDVSAMSKPPVVSPAVPLTGAKPERDAGFPMKVAGISTAAAGVVLLGVGVGMGVAAKSKADVADKYCDGNDCTSQRGVDANEDAKSKAKVSTIGLVTGGVLVGTGVTLWLIGNKRASREHSVGSLSNLRLSPIAGASEFGAILSGRW